MSEFDMTLRSFYSTYILPLPRRRNVLLAILFLCATALLSLSLQPHADYSPTPTHSVYIGLEAGSSSTTQSSTTQRNQILIGDYVQSLESNIVVIRFTDGTEFRHSLPHKTVALDHALWNKHPASTAINITGSQE